MRRMRHYRGNGSDIRTRPVKVVLRFYKVLIRGVTEILIGRRVSKVLIGGRVLDAGFDDGSRLQVMTGGVHGLPIDGQDVLHGS